MLGSVESSLSAAGFRVRRLPRCPSLYDDICEVRALASHLVDFHATTAAALLARLWEYRWQWDAAMGCARQAPEHGEASHGADAYRYMCRWLLQRGVEKSAQIGANSVIGGGMDYDA
ncbi:hypothetical protein FACS1894186_4780 [Alphaproteobacteria bacterium]|nr:hypothetical protein FACS1894186_4780 [Alphaproteobacteria bacterium]